MTKYFVNQNGFYLGGFDGAEPPIGAIEIASPPNDGRDKWNGKRWIRYIKTEPDVNGLAEAIWADSVLLPIRLKIVGFQSLIAGELPKGPTGLKRVQEGWLQLQEELALPKDLVSYIELLAKNYNVLLVP